jgi:hypothetical protein
LRPPRPTRSILRPQAVLPLLSSVLCRPFFVFPLPPRQEELRSVVEIIRQSLAVDIDVGVNVNNHDEGGAHLTIQRLLNLLAPPLDAHH